MATTFDDWLRHLRAAKQGPVSINIDRGTPFVWPFAIKSTLPDARIRASLRLYPDAAGASIVDFTASEPEVAAADNGTFTVFTLSLTANQTANLPADGDGDSLVTLAFDVLLAPTGIDFSRIFAGPATVSGKVTNAS